MKFTIRKASPQDIAALIQVHKLTWLATYPSVEFGITEKDIAEKDFDNPERATKWAERLKRSDLVIFVAEINTNVVGFAEIQLGEEKNHLETIYILPNYQGCGLGKALLRQIIAVADKDKSITLQVATYNQKAISFYQKNGFVKSGQDIPPYILPNGKKIPLLEMVKS